MGVPLGPGGREIGFDRLAAIAKCAISFISNLRGTIHYEISTGSRSDRVKRKHHPVAIAPGIDLTSKDPNRFPARYPES